MACSSRYVLTLHISYFNNDTTHFCLYSAYDMPDGFPQCGYGDGQAGPGGGEQGLPGQYTLSECMNAAKEIQRNGEWGNGVTWSNCNSNGNGICGWSSDCDQKCSCFIEYRLQTVPNSGTGWVSCFMYPDDHIKQWNTYRKLKFLTYISGLQPELSF